MRRPSNKQTNKQNRTKFKFEKDQQFIEKWVDFYEFRGVSSFERKFDFDVISEKLCLWTHVSRFWPAGLIINPFSADFGSVIQKT